MALTKVVDGIVIPLSEDEEKELREAWAAVDAAQAKVAYIDSRKSEYPTIGDQMDAILKQMVKLQQAGIALDADMAAVVTQWQAVKTKYPKPVK